MPELPEIEALRETLVERTAGRQVRSVGVRQFALVKTFTPPIEALVGETLLSGRRHGKHLLLDFSGALTLAVHLGIGGRLLLADAGKRPSRFVSLELGLDDGPGLWIVELGSKKQSSVHLLLEADVPAHLAGLGIDALSPDLTVEALAGLLGKQRVQLKGFLEDQRKIAGIGNAYSDEILWEAKLSPLQWTTSLRSDEMERLHAAVGSVFREAAQRARQENYLLTARGDERGFFRVHRRERQPCPRCGEPIASVYFAESSLQYCPACQVGGRRYADRRLSRLLR